MRSRPKERGATLLEALIAIAIVATISAAASATIFRPNDRLALNQSIAQLSDEAATQRARAITRGQAVLWRPAASPDMELSNCEEDTPQLRFTSKGAALGDDICLQAGDLAVTLRPDWLTGALVRIEE